MNEFLKFNGVADMTLFTIVLGELCDFSVSIFRQKIERFTEGGGDGGLTRLSIHAACGLPAEDVALHPDGAGHGVAAVGVVETVAATQLPGWLLGDEEAGTSARSTTSAG